MTVDLKIACRKITLVRMECLYWSIRCETPVWSTLCHWTNRDTPLQNASLLGPIHTERQPNWKRKLFHVCSLYFDIFLLVVWSFSLLVPLFLGVNAPVTLQLLRPFSQLRDCKPLYISVEPTKTSTHHIRDIKVAKVSVPLQNPQLFTDGCGISHSLCRVWSDSVNGSALTFRETDTSDWHHISLVKGTVSVPI